MVKSRSRSRTFPGCRGTVAVLGLVLLAAACGSSNAERPSATGAGPAGSGGVAINPGGGGNAGGGGMVPGASNPGGASGGASGGANSGSGGSQPDGGTTSPSDVATSDTATPTDMTAPIDGIAPASPVATSCPVKPVPACDSPPPPAPMKRAWKSLGSNLITAGNPQHRGRDLFFVEGQPQWLIAKFGYAPFDSALSGEDVEITLLRNCAGAWESLGTGVTTSAGDQPTIEGAADSGGRIYVPLPPARALGPGRHRVHFIVAGDGSRTDQFIEVVPANTALAVVDVDGTLTTSETAEFGSLLTGQISTAHPDAAATLRTLAGKGYRPYYLTARPEWLMQRTREFLGTGEFPPGIIETTSSGTGAQGADAQTFKTAALMRIRQKQLVPWLGIGNTDTDAAAYAGAISAPSSRYFYNYSDTANGGKRFDSYADLLKELAQLPSLCR